MAQINDSAEYAADREKMLTASKVMRRNRMGKRGWGDDRHHSVLQRFIMLSWGGQKYDTE